MIRAVTVNPMKLLHLRLQIHRFDLFIHLFLCWNMYLSRSLQAEEEEDDDDNGEENEMLTNKIEIKELC